MPKNFRAEIVTDEYDVLERILVEDAEYLGDAHQAALRKGQELHPHKQVRVGCVGETTERVVRLNLDSNESIVEGRARPEGVTSEGGPGERGAALFEIQANFLLGKVLTTVDAAVVDARQNEAVKEIIRQQFRDQIKWVFAVCGDTPAAPNFTT